MSNLKPATKLLKASRLLKDFSECKNVTGIAEKRKVYPSTVSRAIDTVSKEIIQIQTAQNNKQKITTAGCVDNISRISEKAESIERLDIALAGNNILLKHTENKPMDTSDYYSPEELLELNNIRKDIDTDINPIPEKDCHKE
jgi:hypothetical protein